VPAYEHDPGEGAQLLDAAGYPSVNGVRFHLTMKTSTNESTRLIVAVMQQQLREVGIALDIRSFEPATFFLRRDSRGVPALQPALDRRQRGSRHFRICISLGEVSAEWGQPRLLFESESGCADRPGPPRVDPRCASRSMPRCRRLLAEDLPYINLWYLDNVLVHTRVRNT
jgi:peptide/nickel transport system substrate-binding protein